MAAPNLLSLTTAHVDTAILNATNTITDIIAAVTTGHAFSIEAVYCSNIHATVAGWVTVIHKKGGTEYKIANQLRIPTKVMLNALLGRSLYLAEGDSLRIQANASSNITVFVPYSDVS